MQRSHVMCNICVLAPQERQCPTNRCTLSTNQPYLPDFGISNMLFGEAHASCGGCLSLVCTCIANTNSNDDTHISHNAGRGKLFDIPVTFSTMAEVATHCSGGIGDCTGGTRLTYSRSCYCMHFTHPIPLQPHSHPPQVRLGCFLARTPAWR